MSVVRPDKSKLFYRELPPSWWLSKQSYFLFMLRELSSLFIAIFLVVFLIQLYQLTRGPEAYVAFARKLSSPGWILFNLITLLFALYHSITWFYSSAIVLPLRIGEREIPRNLFVALNIGALIVVSLVIWGLFLALNG
jgi:fumarate reductase subunit C